MGGATVSVAWTRIFNLSWIVGFVGSSIIYWVICKISPPPGAPYVTEYYDEAASDIIPGVPDTPTDAETGTVTVKAEKA